MGYLMKTKMTKKTGKEQKRKSNQSAENENGVHQMLKNSMKNFVKQHNKELNNNHAQILSLTEQNDHIRIVDSSKKSTLDELNRNLEFKTNVLEEMRARFEKLQRVYQDLQKFSHLQKIKISDLEMSYEKDCKSLSDQLQHANEQLAAVSTLLSAKEAECAAYLTDMRTQLEKANLKNAQSEQQISELQNKVLQLEKMFDTYKEEEAVERQNSIKEYEDKIEKDKMTHIKKNKRINSLEKKIKALRDEKKALQNSLDIQGHKIRDLQRVLNRPINASSPVYECNEAVQRQTKQVEPLIPVHNTSSSSSRAATPEVELNTQANQSSDKNFLPRIRTSSVYNNNENEHINNVSKNQPQEALDYSSSTSSVHKRKNVELENRPPSPSNTHQLKRSCVPFNKNDDSGDTSDNNFFPAYDPNKKEEAVAQKTASKPIKRIRK